MRFKNYNEFINYYENLGAFHCHNLSFDENIIEDLSKEDEKHLFYERLGFGFSYKKDSDRIYHPMAIFQRKDGSTFGSPDRCQITPECVKYWILRSSETKSNYMKFRYLTLLVDFLEDVLGKENIIKEYGKDYLHNITNEAIDSGIQIIKEKIFCDNIYAINYIDVLLRISNRYSPKRLNEISSLCITFENEIADDNLPGYWGFSYNFLIERNECKNITKSQEQGIIKELEDRFNRLKSEGNISGVGFVGDRLLKYYKLKDDNEKIKLILNGYEETYQSKDFYKLSPLIQSSYYEDLKKLYIIYDNKNQKKIEELNLKIISFGAKILKELKTYKSEFKISDRELKKIVGCYYDDKEKKIKEGAFVIGMIHKQTDSRKQLNKLMKEFPLQYLGVKKFYDKDGICTGIIEGNEKKNYNLHLIGQYQFDVSIGNIWLNYVCKLIKKNNRDINYLERGVLKLFNKKEILTKLWKLYINGNNLEFCCIAIPLIESTFREMLRKVGGCIIIDNNGKLTTEYKNMKQILNDPVFRATLPKGYSDFVYYCNVLFINKYGFNFRNKLSHGLELDKFNSESAANRIFHVLFCLSLLNYEF